MPGSRIGARRSARRGARRGGAGRGAWLVGLGLLAACHTEGVLPEGLARRGSTGSLDYVVAERLPASSAPVVLVAPRLGDPALLAPDATQLAVTLWLRAPEDATALRLHAARVPGTTHPTEPTPAADPLPAGAVSLPPTEAPRCGPSGLCHLTVRLPEPGDPALPDGLPTGLCVETPAARSCAPAAWQRFERLPAPLTLAVLSDLHVGKAHALARTEGILAALGQSRPRPDLVLVTGDLTDAGDATHLRPLVARLADLSPAPVVALPGNHDYKAGRIGNFLDLVTPRLNHAHRLGPYRLVALDTGPGRWDQERRATNGQTTGLGADQIAWLAEALASDSRPDPATLLLVHSPPYTTIGSVFTRRRDAFVRHCRDAGVSLILAGHTHRLEAYDYAGIAQGLSVWRADSVPRRRMPVTLVSARSTDRTDGGYRWIDLWPDGAAAYRWVRVPGLD